MGNQSKAVRSAVDVCREIRDVEAARASLVELLSDERRGELSEAERVDVLAVLEESVAHLDELLAAAA